MALNTLEYAVQLQTILDNAAEAALTSSWMDANAGQVQYDGGNKVKMPQMEVTGLKDYDRDKGYPDGSVTLKFEDYTMTQDRGTSFQLDAMDINETNFIANATRVVSLFQKEQVVPEIDAYRYSKLYALLKEGGKNTDYTVADDTLWDALMDDIAKVRDEIGEEIPLVISIRQAVKSRLEKNAKYQKVVNAAQFTAGKIQTNLNQIDNCYLRPVPSARMKTAYVFRDGKSGGEENDPVLRLMLEDAVTAVTLFCNRDVFPWQLEYVVRHMAERAFERDNGDNVAAIKRGDTQITYGTALSQDDMSQEERDICCKFRRLRVL